MSYLVGALGYEMRIEEDLERELLATVDAMAGGLVEPLRAECERIAQSASATFYDQVDRETGRTGVIRTEVTITSDVVVVSVGSTRTETFAGGSPVARRVHRPGPDSTKREIRPANAPLGPKERVRRRLGANVEVVVPNPKASDGRSMLVELVEKPARAALDRLVADGTIDRAIQRRINGGR